MRWEGRQQSSNIEDRRGIRVGRGGAIGGVGGILVLLVSLYLGVDPALLMQGLEGVGGGTQTRVPYEESADEAVVRERVSVVLADTEQTWRDLFSAAGQQYRDPTLVLFSGAVESACGLAQAAVGPFYCPADQQVYIDLSFYEELGQRFGAPGDFAQAYVIAHEIGHHVQNLLGGGERPSPGAEGSSVRTELQADCYAGVWGHFASSRQLLEPGDVEEGLAAASAIGDDRLQMRSQGYVSPESFTHGSSEQRVRWFRRGLQSGSLQACDTFSARDL